MRVEIQRTITKASARRLRPTVVRFLRLVAQCWRPCWRIRISLWEKRFNTLFLKKYFSVLRFDYERAFRI